MGSNGRKPRAAHDFYSTSPNVVEALVSTGELHTQPRFFGTSKPAPIWEPACGQGHIVKVLNRHGHPVTASDIADRGFLPAKTGVDFLLERDLLAPVIVTNPPFSLAADFARHAFELGCSKLVMLLKMSFLEARCRVDLVRDCPAAHGYNLSRVYGFIQRAKTEREGMPVAGQPMFHLAWMVWEAVLVKGKASAQSHTIQFIQLELPPSENENT